MTFVAPKKAQTMRRRLRWKSEESMMNICVDPFLKGGRWILMMLIWWYDTLPSCCLWLVDSSWTYTRPNLGPSCHAVRSNPFESMTSHLCPWFFFSASAWNEWWRHGQRRGHIDKISLYWVALERIFRLSSNSSVVGLDFVQVSKLEVQHVLQYAMLCRT